MATGQTSNGWDGVSGEIQAQTGRAGHRVIPGGPVAIKKYYINELMYFAQ